MIYGGHAYCFPKLTNDGGFADPEQFKRHLQAAVAGHFQPSWRKNGRAPRCDSGLADRPVLPSVAVPSLARRDRDDPMLQDQRTMDKQFERIGVNMLLSSTDMPIGMRSLDIWAVPSANASLL